MIIHIVQSDFYQPASTCRRINTFMSHWVEKDAIGESKIGSFPLKYAYNDNTKDARDCVECLLKDRLKWHSVMIRAW